MSDKWIQAAVTHHGAFRKKAQAAGKTTEQYAEEKQSAPGILGHQARLAKTLMHLSGASSKPQPKTTIGSNTQ